jgi:hypothetical protein
MIQFQIISVEPNAFFFSLLTTPALSHFLSSTEMSPVAFRLKPLKFQNVSLWEGRSEGPGSIPGTTRKKNNGSGTGSTQPREYN